MPNLELQVVLGTSDWRWALFCGDWESQHWQILKTICTLLFTPLEGSRPGRDVPLTDVQERCLRPVTWSDRLGEEHLHASRFAGITLEGPLLCYKNTGLLRAVVEGVALSNKKGCNYLESEPETLEKDLWIEMEIWE